MTPQHLIECLAELGETADEVAASLARRGITGVPGMSDACPLRNFGASLGLEIDVGNDEVLLWPPRAPAVFVALPDACVAFVARLDGGAYPELRAKGVAPSEIVPRTPDLPGQGLLPGIAEGGAP